MKQYLSSSLVIAFLDLLMLATNIPFISHLIAGALSVVAFLYIYAYFNKSVDTEYCLSLLQVEGLTLNQLFPNPNLKFGAILVLLVACGLFHPILAIIIASGIFCEQQLTK